MKTDDLARKLRASALPYPGFALIDSGAWRLLITCPPSPGPEWHLSASWRGAGIVDEPALEALVCALGIPPSVSLHTMPSGVRHYYWKED